MIIASKRWILLHVAASATSAAAAGATAAAAATSTGEIRLLVRVCDVLDLEGIDFQLVEFSFKLLQLWETKSQFIIHGCHLLSCFFSRSC